MAKVLFVPLNTNHVLIFDSIIKSLSCDYEVLCHDRISEGMQFYTEVLLRKMRMRYRHFAEGITRSQKDGLPRKVVSFFKMKKRISDTLRLISPSLIVLAIDNDPICQVLINGAKKRGIKTVLVQEALVRPHEYRQREEYASDHFYALLRKLGIYLSFTRYGSGDCNKILVGGSIAAGVLKGTGIPEERLSVVGLPKYDAFFKNLQGYRPVENQKKVYLYATSTMVLQDDGNIRFLRKLCEAAEKMGFHLIVKLHPRLPQRVEEVYAALSMKKSSAVDIIKGGDETFELLKKADAFITVSSTMILDALLMDKECIVANYLAGESRLEYGKYDAVHSVESEKEIESVLKNSMVIKKPYGNKVTLLEDELYKLDGCAGWRAAQVIKSMI